MPLVLREYSLLQDFIYISYYSAAAQKAAQSEVCATLPAQGKRYKPLWFL